MVRRTRKQKGSAYIAEGSYGCGFRPALPCEGNTSRTADSISKLMQKNHAEKEYQLHDIFVGIDPDQKHFIYPRRICRPDVASITAANQISLCRLAKNAGDPNLARPSRTKFYRNLRNAKIIEYPDGGTDLLAFRLQSDLVYEYFKGFANLLEGLVALHAAGYAHLDIKRENVVAKVNGPNVGGKRTLQMRFIDFGFLSNGTTIYTEFGRSFFQSMYFAWPFDFFFLGIRTADD
jgi:hypothetical protein